MSQWPVKTSSPKLREEGLISLAEAKAAIYIDFEGFVELTPSLLGIRIESNLTQVVLDPNLHLAAQAKELPCAGLRETIEELITRCRQERRLIIGYSQHEKLVIKQYAEIDLTGHYRDARMIAKRWKNKLHHGHPLPGWGLKDFLIFINYARGAHLGEQKSTSRLKAVGDMLAKKQDYQRLTPVAKAKWTKLLEHNQIDCEGMQALVLKAAGELESAE